ncbi:hypothetical protein Tco_1060317 [Tanacetum coccineum]
MDKKTTQSNPPTPEKPLMPPISSFPTIEKSADEHEICDGYLNEKEQQQLLLDEEALRETLEEEARAENFLHFLSFTFLLLSFLFFSCALKLEN